ncbi:unnamed protein product [Closterium sp. Yama58-4]|nr:unnamed protein product [Closterium sp. Yama58-4]
MASHSVPVTRSLGLVLAALAVVMLSASFPSHSILLPLFPFPPLPHARSACAPRAAAIRHSHGLLTAASSNAADHSCVQRNCGANAVCVKDRGSATCVCNIGFSMTPTGCVEACHVGSTFLHLLFLISPLAQLLPLSPPSPDTCALKACGSNGKCIKDSAGVASCVCNTGFVLQADKVTCTGAYVLMCDCEKPRSDTCVLKKCGGNSKCVKSAAGVASCVCDTGFVLQPDGVTCTDTCALKACGVNGKCIKDSAGAASCICDPGFVLQADKTTCTDTCVLKKCGSNSKCVKSAAGVASCVCDTGFVLQPDGVTCTDTCALKACGVNGKCIKDSAGVASCVCGTGFVLQADGVTCTDTCKIQNCGVNGTCNKDKITGAASCVCDTGFVLQADGVTCTGECHALRDAMGIAMCHVPCLMRCRFVLQRAKYCKCHADARQYLITEAHQSCINTCVLKKCGVNGKCIKDSAGVASCVCNVGFALQLDALHVPLSFPLLSPSLPSCISSLPSLLPTLHSLTLPPPAAHSHPFCSCLLSDTCVIKNCGANAACVKDGEGVASCVCNTGFQMVKGLCVDTCEIQNCVRGWCIKDQFGAASCECSIGYVLQADNRTCKDVCEIQKCGANSQCFRGSDGAYCVCAPGFVLQPDNRTCISAPPAPDTCVAQECGVNGRCIKDDSGAASCVCESGFVLQADGRTCTDVCEIQNCGANGHCFPSGDGAVCVCDKGFVLQDDGKTCTGT